MKTREKLLLMVGAATLALAVIGGMIALLYWLTGLVGHEDIRWYSVILTLALPVVIFVTHRLATYAAREHLAGFNRGLDGAERTITSIGRGLSATASLARTSRVPARPVQSNDDLLPRVGTMRLIETSYNADEVVDL